MRHDGTMRIAYGTDAATPLTDILVAWLAESGHDVEVVADGAPWPDVGRGVGEAVTAGRADLGIVCCYTGTGVSIAANKVPGVRAALCGDAVTAAGARRWNDANVLAISLRSTSSHLLLEMVEAFLTNEVDDSELRNIAAVER